MSKKPEIELNDLRRWTRVEPHTTGNILKDAYLNNLFQAFANHNGNPALIVAYIAGGKSLLQAFAQAEWPGEAENIITMAMVEIDKIKEEFEL